MTLGKRQQKILDWYADLLKRNPGVVELHVSVGRYQYLSREMGGGSGYPIFVSAFECYEEGRYQMRRNWLAMCQYEHTVEAKLQEVCDYFAGHGCDMDRVEMRGLK